MTATPSNPNTTEAMFSKIAPRYDCCNHLFSLGIDRLWRKRLVRLTSPKADDAILDLCCGTGDMAFAFAKHSPARSIIGADFSNSMIQLARQKQLRLASRRWMTDKHLCFSVDDATAMSFEANTFDLTSCVFGLRNIPDRAAALTQMHRVLKPGGHAAICEFFLPDSPILRAVYWFYLSRIMPLAGRLLLGDTNPLRYLAQSIKNWHETVKLNAELAQTGFINIRCTPLTGGIVTITIGQKP